MQRGYFFRKLYSLVLLSVILSICFQTLTVANAPSE